MFSLATSIGKCLYDDFCVSKRDKDALEEVLLPLEFDIFLVCVAVGLRMSLYPSRLSLDLAFLLYRARVGLELSRRIR